MKIVRGDLIQLARDGAFDVIVHGCNCQCTMDAGIAQAIRAAFPAAFEADLATAKGDRAKLGTISCAEVEAGGHRFVVVNAYTQFDFAGKAPLVDYDAVEASFREVARRFGGRRIGYPLIGAGLGGGDWEVIAAILDEALAGQDHTLVEFAG